MFEGFTACDLDVAQTTIHGRYGGSAPPLLLLHVIPETHVMWHPIAPGSPLTTLNPKIRPLPTPLIR
jgi:hypothetical protein